jgi:histidine ammonia-lyase
VTTGGASLPIQVVAVVTPGALVKLSGEVIDRIRQGRGMIEEKLRTEEPAHGLLHRSWQD